MTPPHPTPAGLLQDPGTCVVRHPQAKDLPADRAASDHDDGVGRIPGDRSTVDVIDPGMAGGDPCGSGAQISTGRSRPSSSSLPLSPRPPSLQLGRARLRVGSRSQVQTLRHKVHGHPGRAWPGRALRAAAAPAGPRRDSAPLSQQAARGPRRAAGPPVTR